MERFGIESFDQYTSMLVGRGVFVGDPWVFEMILLAFLVGTLVWVAMEGVSVVGRQILRYRRQAGRREQCLQRIIELERWQHKRQASLTQDLERMTDEYYATRKAYEKARRSAAAIVDAESQYLRVLGDEINGKSCYHAYVYNRYVEQWNQAGKTHSMLHESWSRPQPLQIWATTLVEARSMVASRYPTSHGFVVARLVPSEKRFAQVVDAS